MNKALPLLISLTLAVVVGCGGGGQTFAPPPPPPSTVTSVAASPAATTLPVGQIQQFAATVQGTGSFDPAVSWEVDDVAGGNATFGTISSNGLYTAPTTLSVSPFTVAIKARSVQDPTKFGIANVTVHVTVALSPSPINVPTRAHQAFLAKVDGSSNRAVNWGATAGTITDLGIFTVNGVPLDVGLYRSPGTLPTPATVSVTAAAQVDPAQSATASASLFIPQNRSSQPLPVALGTSGGNEKDFPTATSCASGTLGSLLARGTSFFILSNNHVLALSNAGMAGDPISQPGLIEVNCSLANVKTVANLSQFANVQTANVDAAIAQIQAGAVDTSGPILGFGPATGSSAPPANSVVPAMIGMPVAKSGRTTGLTCAHVLATNVTVRVDYEPPSGMLFTVTFSNQIEIEDDLNVPGFSDPGDSGSLVVNSQTAQPVGLLFAGGEVFTVANPIQDALNALKDATGVAPTVVGGAQHQITCPVPSPTFASAQAEAQTRKAEVSQASLAQAKAVKEKHEKELMADPAVISVGTTVSDDRPGEAAILVLVERGKLHGPIPSEIEGVQVKVQESSPFRALGRAKRKKKQRRACCRPPDS